jgi:hypothetical protein
VSCVLLLTNTSGATVVKGFVMLVLLLLVGRTARAPGPFVDDGPVATGLRFLPEKRTSAPALRGTAP